MKVVAPVRVGFCLMAFSLAAAVLLTGGVYPSSWQWIAVIVSFASILCLIAKPRCPKTRGGFILLALLLGWMAIFLVPFPAALVEHLFPTRWSAVAAARQATGQSVGAWLALSLAPASTMERLLDVLPALAVFVAAREMGWWWRHRIWLPAAPVIFVAWIESVLGLVQFGMMRAAGGDVASSTGSYVNPNHFAGLLEMAFPLALAGAFAVWRRRAAWSHAVLLSGVLLVVAGTLLAGIVLSLSRMAFIATLFTAAVTTLVLVLPRGSVRSHERRFQWRWIMPLAMLFCILLLFPTRELKKRFEYTAANQEVTTDTRVAIWRNTLQLISAHKWAGTGLGAYERGLYPYKTVKPTNTLDYAHNDYLQILAELGIPGALLVAALGVWILRSPIRIALHHPKAPNWELAVGLLGALIAIGIHSLTDFNLYIPANALALAWLAGLAVSPGELTCG